MEICHQRWKSEHPFKVFSLITLPTLLDGFLGFQAKRGTEWVSGLCDLSLIAHLCVYH